MVGIGFGEMIIIAGVALVIIGPEKFPEFAKIVLRTVRDLRGYVEEAKRDLSQELKPIQRELEDVSRHNPEDYMEAWADSVMGEDNLEDQEFEEAYGEHDYNDDESGDQQDEYAESGQTEPDTGVSPEKNADIDQGNATDQSGETDEQSEKDGAAMASDTNMEYED